VGKPTVLWSGNGVHTCQPVEAVVLEQESKFAEFDQPSQTFLKFAAQFLSNHKSDTNNNPAFKSCLLRIPGSYNSKYIEQNKEIAKVKVIQGWDGFRPKINPLLYHFYIHLADRKLKEFNNMRKIQTSQFRGNTIPWIEKLLETPIDDYRKNAVSLVLAPYLVNIRKLSYEAALNIFFFAALFFFVFLMLLLPLVELVLRLLARLLSNCIIRGCNESTISVSPHH
jgi:hypothetical protein